MPTHFGHGCVADTLPESLAHAAAYQSLVLECWSQVGQVRLPVPREW